MPTTAISLGAVRERFPSLKNPEVYMDNAGGSQVPATVPDAIRNYMLTSYVQVGAEYPASARATSTVARAHELVNLMMGGQSVGRAILGSSSSTLCRMLADCYLDVLQPGDEVVVGESGHEANVGPWARLATRGITVKVWQANPETGVCELSELERLLSPRTKVVAFVHVSNILGQVEDIGPCVDAAHRVGARVVVDGVAYAPHLAMDVESWGVDWYVFSCYKVFGPHIGALFGRHEAIAELTGPNHYFLPKDYLPGKFELGGPNHESCAGLGGTAEYLSWLAGTPNFNRESVRAAWGAMVELEAPLTEYFLEYLRAKSKVKVIGKAEMSEARVPTIAFLHSERSPKEIADAAMAAQIGIRWGNFYSVRLLERLGIDPKQGVCRVSFAHYNSPEEVDRLVAAIDPVLT